MSNGDFKNPDKKNTGRDDLFWEIEYMLPPKKTTAAFSRDTETVEIDIIRGTASDSGVFIPKKSAPGSEPAKKYISEPVCSYKPDNQLITNVSVWHWPSKYSFYERFRADALKYYFLSGTQCEFIAFFSYMPQYMQLNREQRDYYLWWRDNARRNIWLQTDYSYIFLYIYEIINLPDFISPVKGLDMLCGLWLSQRTKFPKLDRYLTEWICDYCLVNMMEPPYIRLAPIMGSVLACASFKEFYLKPGIASTHTYASALLNFASNYNWRSGKFYNAETADFFDKHIEGAFFHVVEKLSASDSRFTANGGNMMPARLTRDAFSGSLCAYNIKRRIDVEYSSCTRSPELRILVTDLIKCVENHVRALLGVKNRFSTSSLTEDMKKFVDEYFEPYKQKKKTKENEIPDYMKLYDTAQCELSPDSALDIEKRSWDITSRLVDAFSEATGDNKTTDSENGIIETVISGENAPDISDDPNDSDTPDTTDLISPLVWEGLAVITAGNVDFGDWAAGKNMMPETAAELINEALYHSFGDIVMENDGYKYRIIEDYLSEVKNLLTDRKSLNS